MQLTKGFKFVHGANATGDVLQSAQSLQMAKATAESHGDFNGAFGEFGNFAANVGNIKELGDESECEDDKDGKAGDKDKEGSAKAGESDKDKDKANWCNREELIRDEMKKHQTWMTTTERNLKLVKQEIRQAIKSARSPEVYSQVESDVEIARGRDNALSLVLAVASPLAEKINDAPGLNATSLEEHTRSATAEAAADGGAADSKPSSVTSECYPFGSPADQI